MFSALLLAALLAAPASASANQPTELRGRVVGITDGDTISLLTAERRVTKIRLLAVGAPETSCKGKRVAQPDLLEDTFCVEKGQPFGKAAKKALSDITFNREVMVRVKGTSHDRYVGQVMVGDVDAGLAMLKKGYACYAENFGRRGLDKAAQLAYAQAHESAKSAHVGMWANKDAQCDDEYRAEQRRKRAAQ